MESMKCIDCKFCAFINEDNEPITVKSNGFETPWYTMPGAYCMKAACTIPEVEECSGYEKSKHKTIKPIK